jgi:hypothetical protein
VPVCDELPITIALAEAVTPEPIAIAFDVSAAVTFVLYPINTLSLPVVRTLAPASVPSATHEEPDVRALPAYVPIKVLFGAAVLPASYPSTTGSKEDET